MARSKCSAVDCNSNNFELVQANISGSKFKYHFIQCSRCGAVISVVPYNNTNALIFQLAEKLGHRLD